MSPRVAPPFRADHVGSLLRPQRLLDARDEHAAGRIDDAELRRIEDEAITEVVAMQEEVGLSSATDGEFRRSSWHMDFLYQLDGVEKVEDGNLKVQFHNEQGDIEFVTPDLRVTERIGLSGTIFADAFTALTERVTKATPKLTIPSPGMLHYRGGRAAIDETVYPDLAEFRADLAAAYRAEVRALADLGCHYLQLDDTSLAYLNDPKQRAQLAARGDDAEHAHLQTIELINNSLRGRPDTLSVTTHMCRGNFRSSWVAEGGYDFVAEALFNELEVDGFFLEFDDERSGTFAPLRFVPKGKAVVLGLITTKRGELESKDALKRRIEEASKYVDLDQLCLSPQCGFASTKDGNALTYEQEVAKLRLVVETAAEVWG
jgi:5-methyltetrahydropteroyltriglutamate--homocysteine methyltransferase